MNYRQNWSSDYNSYGGVDIKIVLGNVEIGNAQGISLSITREKAPIFVMGSKDPVSFSRGKRGIAGSLVLTVFSNNALHDFKQSDASHQNYWASDRDILYRPANEGLGARDLNANDPSALFQPGVGRGEARPVNYADQILPFNIVVVGFNEYNGNPSAMRLWGVEILNEGTGSSTGDVSLDSQMTFIARSVSPWARVTS